MECRQKILSVQFSSFSHRTSYFINLLSSEHQPRWRFFLHFSIFPPRSIPHQHVLCNSSRLVAPSTAAIATPCVRRCPTSLWRRLLNSHTTLTSPRHTLPLILCQWLHRVSLSMCKWTISTAVLLQMVRRCGFAAIAATGQWAPGTAHAPAVVMCSVAIARRKRFKSLSLNSTRALSSYFLMAYKTFPASPASHSKPRHVSKTTLTKTYNLLQMLVGI